MKKDVNLGLLGLILFLLVVFILIVSFYQFRFGILSTDYENKTEALEEVTARSIVIDEQAVLLNRSNARLLEDKDDLEKRYVLVSSELEQMKKDKVKLELELVSVKEELLRLTSEYDSQLAVFSKLQERFYQVEGALENANSQIGSLSHELEEACDELQKRGGDSGGC